MSKLKDMELLNELVNDLLAPAVRGMIREFEPKRLERKNKLYKTRFKTLIESSENHATIYCHTLKALYNVLDKDFSLAEKPSHNRILELTTGKFLFQSIQNIFLLAMNSIFQLLAHLLKVRRISEHLAYQFLL